MSPLYAHLGQIKICHIGIFDFSCRFISDPIYVSCIFKNHLERPYQNLGLTLWPLLGAFRLCLKDVRGFIHQSALLDQKVLFLSDLYTFVLVTMCIWEMIRKHLGIVLRSQRGIFMQISIYKKGVRSSSIQIWDINQPKL